MKNQRLLRLVALAGIVMLGACDLDVENPNAATEDEVLSDPNGVIALGVGLQQQFAQSVEDYLVPVALITDEWGTRTPSLLSYQSLFTGLSFENTYVIVDAPYANTYQIVKTANTLLSAVDALDLGTGLEAGLRAEAKLFKAMALGWAAQLFASLPIDVADQDAPLVARTEVLDAVIVLLESARADVASVPDADLAGFRSRVLGAGINLSNTIDAMIARYSLIRGQNQKAIDAATRVSPTVLSTLTYPAPTINPIYALAISINYVGGIESFVQQAEAGDRRPAYWLNTAVAPVAGNPSTSRSYTLAKFNLPNEPYPLYLPDEMKLIRAEAQARLGNLAAARTLINEVRTQTTSAVNEPVAGLPALSDAALPDLASILRQIAYERRYELYMQGLRWEDIRRLGITTHQTFPFLPLPANECRNNPNARPLCT